MVLGDTNVLAELSRRSPDRGVLEWAERTSELAVSAVTLEEISFGLAWKPVPRVVTWFLEFLAGECQVLPVTEEVARLAGQLRGRLQAAGKTRTQADMLIAATAKLHGLTLVTRNVRDFADCGIAVLDPFTGDEGGART